MNRHEEKYNIKNNKNKHTIKKIRKEHGANALKE